MGVATDEDPTVPPQERVQRFGQADHVRYYGDDFESRLEGAGLQVFTTDFHQVLSSEVLARIGADHSEEIWLASREGSPEAYLGLDQHVATHLEAVLPPDLVGPGHVRTLDDLARTSIRLFQLMDESHQALAESNRWRTEAASWRSRYEHLRRHPYVRFGTAVRRQLGRMATALRRPSA
jgi:hypothetical protein